MLKTFLTHHLTIFYSLIFTLPLLLIKPDFIYATNYYVSPGGDDANSGLTVSAPWQTIAKINSMMSTFQPGDSILFERNGTFNGGIVISVSGASGKPIVFGAYGAGSNPVITSDTILNSWTDDGANKWKCPYNKKPGALYINNVPQQIARYPNRYGTANGGYLTYSSFSGDTEITSSTNLANIWAGGQVAVRIERYILQINTVKYQDGGVNENIHFTPAFPQVYTQTGFGFFFENDTNALDIQGEWCYQNGNLYLYSTTNPSSLNVSIPQYGYNITCNSHNYITIENLTLEDADSGNVNVSASNYFTMELCLLTQSGIDGVDVINNSSHFSCENNLFTNLPNDGIYLYNETPGAIIENNKITNIGTVPGMASNELDAGGNAIFFDGTGTNFLCRYNYCDSTGRHGISLFQDTNSMTVENNYIAHAGMALEDLGGIHILGKASAVNKSCNITGNIILNGVGTPYGTNDTLDDGFTHGIYLDQYSSKFEVTGNSIANMPGNGVEMHNTQFDTLTGNTLFNNGQDEDIILPGAQINMTNQGAYPDDSAIYVAHNILTCLDANQEIFTLYESAHTGNACLTFATYASNFYCHPFADTSTIFYIDDTHSAINAYYGLQQWKTYMSDFYSEPAPEYYRNFSSADSVLFFYNATQSIQNYTLPEGNLYVDVNNNSFSNSVSLNPYTSLVLFYATGIATAIKNLQDYGSITVFPNPNNGIFTILNSKNEPIQIGIYNAAGEIVFQSGILTPQATIDISSLPGGVYMLRAVSQEGGAAIKKIIRE